MGQLGIKTNTTSGSQSGGPWSSRTSIPWELVRNAHSRAPPQTSRIRVQDVLAVLTSLPVAPIKSETHCSRSPTSRAAVVRKRSGRCGWRRLDSEGWREASESAVLGRKPLWTSATCVSPVQQRCLSAHPGKGPC